MKRLVSLVAAVFLAGTAFAQERQYLSADQVAKLATGQTWNHHRNEDGLDVTWTLQAGGTLFGAVISTGKRDSGTWTIDPEGRLCVKWRGSSIDRCVSVARAGGKAFLIDAKDARGTYADIRLSKEQADELAAMVVAPMPTARADATAQAAKPTTVRLYLDNDALTGRFKGETVDLKKLDDGIIRSYAFHDDGTYTVDFTNKNGKVRSVSGRWEIADGKLCVTADQNASCFLFYQEDGALKAGPRDKDARWEVQDTK